jgi:hypothetical protein
MKKIVMFSKFIKNKREAAESALKKMKVHVVFNDDFYYHINK